MKRKVKVDVTIVGDDGKARTRFDDSMLREHFTEYFHDFCRNFFCKSTMLKMPPEPSMEYSYKCDYRYEWLPSQKFGTTIIAKSDIYKEYIIMHVKDIR